MTVFYTIIVLHYHLQFLSISENKFQTTVITVYHGYFQACLNPRFPLVTFFSNYL